MAFTITRLKGGKTHHAASVDARLGTDAGGRQQVTGNGGVTSWTDDPAKAGRFPEAVAAHVLKRHEGRLNAGVLQARDEAGRVVAEVKGTGEPAEPDPGHGGTVVTAPGLHDDLLAERDEFQKQARVLGDVVEQLKADNARLDAEAKQQKKYADATAKVNEEQRKEIEALQKKVKDLEEAAKKSVEKAADKK